MQYYTTCARLSNDQSDFALLLLPLTSSSDPFPTTSNYVPPLINQCMKLTTELFFACTSAIAST